MAAAPAPTPRQRGAIAAAAGAASALALLLGDGAPALAQRVVPKIGSICPLGYVDLFNGKCSTLGLMNGLPRGLDERGRRLLPPQMIG